MPGKPLKNKKAVQLAQPFCLKNIFELSMQPFEKKQHCIEMAKKYWQY